MFNCGTCCSLCGGSFSSYSDKTHFEIDNSDLNETQLNTCKPFILATSLLLQANFMSGALFNQFKYMLGTNG